ncbi:hypothetical protein D3C71_532000 [compost metagenome]
MIQIRREMISLMRDYLEKMKSAKSLSERMSLTTSLVTTSWNLFQCWAFFGILRARMKTKSRMAKAFKFLTQPFRS